jgi:hypothetical protein
VRPAQNWRRFATAAFALTALFTVAACGSETSDSGSSAEAAPDGIEPGDKVSVDEAEELIAVALDAMPTVHVEMEFKSVDNGVNVNATSEGDFQRDPAAFRGKVTMDASDGKKVVVGLAAVGGATYVRTNGAKWVNDRALSRMYTPMMPWPFTMVETTLQSAAVGGDTTLYVGQEEINGTELARYSFGFEEPIAGDMNKGRVNGWFDEEGRLIRLYATVVEGEAVAMDFSQHGENLIISKPKAEELRERG